MWGAQAVFCGAGFCGLPRGLAKGWRRGQPQGSGSPTAAQPSLLLSYVLGVLESRTRSIKVGVVGGSDFEKVQEQLGNDGKLHIAGYILVKGQLLMKTLGPVAI